MSGDAEDRWAHINLPHARTVAGRIGRSLEALGAYSEGGNGQASALRQAAALLERELRPFEEDPPPAEAVRTADAVAELGRALVRAIVETPIRGDRLGQSVRNLFECLGLAAEGAELSLLCGERKDSPLR